MDKFEPVSSGGEMDHAEEAVGQLGVEDWRALLGGTAFLFIPQIAGWLLYVGLATGRMPSAYGRSEMRDTSPRWFWLTGSLYGGLLLFFLYIILSVTISSTIWGF